MFLVISCRAIIMLAKVIMACLALSHGDAAAERSLSVNKKIYLQNNEPVLN